jgi:hypothetical protein
MFLSGITIGELTPCEGFIAKLQKRAAKGLCQFSQDLKMVLITRRVVYWDDTVITVLASGDFNHPKSIYLNHSESKINNHKRSN